MTLDTSNSSTSSIPPTEVIGEEMQKYVSLTRIFLCKVIECIYCNRCPKELSDFQFDEDRWFSLDIPKSPSLRELVSRRTIYGWFQLDVTLTDIDQVVERWILVHEPNEISQTRPLFAGKKSELRYHTFRRYSQIIRSIYSLLNSLPVKTLELCLNQISGTNRRLSAVCSHFHSLPVQYEDFTLQNNSTVKSTQTSSISNNFENLDKYELDFGPIITPLGKCTIRCITIKNTEMYLPKIVEYNNNNNQNKISKLNSKITKIDLNPTINTIDDPDNDFTIISSISHPANPSNIKHSEKPVKSFKDASDFDILETDSEAIDNSSVWFQSFQQNEFSSNLSDEYIKRSFTPELSSGASDDDYNNSGERNSDGSQNFDASAQSPEDFLGFISNLDVNFTNDFDEKTVRQTFKSLSNEVHQLFEEWMQTS
ncbi:hypothetical protein TRFO_08565 [Tritrichomonas foetus]|uniref:Uncharacterized protein n=1 Tax=Tritrichomonas foetus TaxID=1144522 RepID=A0A1J4JK86_9EUKA|nr:hypothetical protein TRFO_08565 [Tritrichomonas foetus]|eukprot:OHS99017.1 hypothetical protein TRFO_08565 [Tritrichomonas foetus]